MLSDEPCVHLVAAKGLELQNQFAWQILPHRRACILKSCLANITVVPAIVSRLGPMRITHYAAIVQNHKQIIEGVYTMKSAKTRLRIVTAIRKCKTIMEIIQASEVIEAHQL